MEKSMANHLFRKVKGINWQFGHLSLAIATAFCSPIVIAAEQNISFMISPQSLSSALNAYAETANVQLSYPAALTEGLISPGVSGQYTTQQALQKLLTGTGITSRTTQNGTVTLERVSNSESSSSTTTLAPVTVTGTVIYDATDPYNPDYSLPNASTATKTDTSIMETPFSVQVVPQQILKDQQVVNLQDATKNISGVQTSFGYGNLYQAFTIRGFETNNVLRNGQRSAGGVGRSMVEMANVNSVEILKGPAAMLYGRLDPGGMVNVITNKPLDTPYYSLQQQFGSYDLYRTSIDATGPINEDKTLLYRLDYSYFEKWLH
jgi:iron complex outermembrane receptor protein